MQRPTGPLCDGCHSVNYNIADQDGDRVECRLREVPRPRQSHTWRSRRATNIVNPARLDFVQANDVCIQCHSQGQPLTNPINGKYYDWPVGFEPGKNLRDFWKLEEHKLGEQTLHPFRRRHRAQEPDAGQRFRAERDVHARRDLLQLPRRARHREQRRPAEARERDVPRMPRPEFAERSATRRPSKRTRITRRAAPGSECVACHMPKIEQTIADVNVRSHTFKFITPAETDALKVPNPCTSCHADKTTKWATDALKSWGNVSAWRVAAQ